MIDQPRRIRRHVNRLGFALLRLLLAAEHAPGPVRLPRCRPGSANDTGAGTTARCKRLSVRTDLQSLQVVGDLVLRDEAPDLTVLGHLHHITVHHRFAQHTRHCTQALSQSRTSSSSLCSASHFFSSAIGHAMHRNCCKHELDRTMARNCRCRKKLLSQAKRAGRVCWPLWAGQTMH